MIGIVDILKFQQGKHLGTTLVISQFHLKTLGKTTSIIERGVALHERNHPPTMGLEGKAWLNFTGNEFGQPEWLDYIRIENNESFHFARGQSNLAYDVLLRYKFLNRWNERTSAGDWKLPQMTGLCLPQAQ